MPGGGRRDAVARCAGLRPTTEPLSGFRENTFAARGHRRGDQHRSACRLAGGTATGQDADLALCGTGACARPVLGEPLRLNRAHTPLPDFFAQCRQHISILYYCNNLCSTKKQISTYRGYFSLLRGVDQQYPTGFRDRAHWSELWLPVSSPVPFWLQRVSLLRSSTITMAQPRLRFRCP